MPNRIVREGLVDSEAFNTMSCHAQNFFVRVMLKADDFGRYYGNPNLLKPYLYALMLEQIREADLSRWIAECEKSGLVRLYELNGKSYIYIPKFGQTPRAKKSKFPDPPACIADAPGDTDTKLEYETRKTKLEYDPVAIWCEEYKRIYHNNPNIDGRDAKCCHEMAGFAKGDDHWRRACRAYLNDHTQFVVGKAHGIFWFRLAKDRYFNQARESVQRELENDGGDDQSGLDAAIESARLATKNERHTGT